MTDTFDWTAMPAEAPPVARRVGPEPVAEAEPVAPSSFSFTPHPYQRKAFDAVWGEFDAGRRSTLVSMPTGSGKTILFGMVAKEAVDNRAGRVLVLAHRDELLEQAQAKLAFVGVHSAIEKAEQRGREAIDKAGRDFFNPRDVRCVVGSVQSLQGERLASWPKDYFSHVVCDEAHHLIRGVGPKKHRRTVVNAQYGAIIDHFSDAKLLAVTATPRRADGGLIGKVCESVAFEYLITDAVDDGYLSPIDGCKSEFEIDLGFINKQAGDLNQGDLEDAISEHIESMVRFIKENLGDRRGILFAPGRKKVTQAIRPCEAFAKALRGVGISALSVWGDHPDRLARLRGFRAGECQVLCNADLLTEGYDAPFVSAIILCRPTLSESLMAQMIGRGTRLHPGKVDCKVIDFTWKAENLKLATPFDLLCPGLDPAALRLADELMSSGEFTNFREAGEEAERRVAERKRKEREEEKRRLAAERDRAKAKAEDIRRAREASEAARRDRLDRSKLDLRVRDGASGIRAVQFNPLGRNASTAAMMGLPKPQAGDGPKATAIQANKLTIDFGWPQEEVRGLTQAAAAEMIRWSFKRYQKFGARTAPVWLCKALMKLGVEQSVALGLDRGQAFEMRDRITGRSRRSG